MTEIQYPVLSQTKLEKTDFLLSASCGLIAGLIDAIFVGDPKNSFLGKEVDKQADNFVVKAAQFFYDNDKRAVQKPKKKPTELHKCISYLEQAFPVKYDARYAKDLNVSEGVLSDMTPSNHHLKSLSHSSDIIGLVFSIIDQYSTDGFASFVDKGKVIHVVPNNVSKNMFPYFYGSENMSKVYCGFINWLGHLLSDVVGSSSTREPGKTGRGMGIPMPFFEMFQFCQFGDFDGDTFADTMVKVYEEGYDFRFGVATAIPVVIEELLIRCIWTIRQKFYYKKSWKESLPTSKNADFRMMLLLGSTTFSVVDGVDALAHSISFDKGVQLNWVGYFSRVNYVGVARLSELILKECVIRAKIAIGKNADAYVESVFGFIPEEKKEKYLLLAESVKSYLDYADYQKAIKESLKEYDEAKKERIRIEKESAENIQKIIECREKMMVIMEEYFADYIVTFDVAVDMMDQGIVENDSNKFIEGNNLIQEKLGKEAQFKNQDEFDSLMGSDDDFKF